MFIKGSEKNITRDVLNFVRQIVLFLVKIVLENYGF